MNQVIAMFRNILGIPSTVTLNVDGSLPVTAAIGPGGVVDANLLVGGVAVGPGNPVPVSVADGADKASAEIAGGEKPVA